MTFHRLVEVRKQCWRYPKSLGLPNTAGVKIEKGFFILNPAERHESDANWLRALKTAAILNQDGLCICCHALGSGELHHALITRRDVQGCGDDVQTLIHHTYNVLVLHPQCHTNATRDECFLWLCALYGAPVADWFFAFPIEHKRFPLDGFSAAV